MLGAVLGGLSVTSGAAGLAALLLGYYWLTSPRGIPPGPRPWPFVGNLPLIRKNIAANNFFGMVSDLRQQYGDVFSLHFGQQLFVFVNTYQLMMDTYVKQGDRFSGRPVNFYLLNIIKERTGNGVLFSEGPVWKELRRMTLMTLRDFGVGKKSLEQRVHAEGEALKSLIDSFGAKPTVLKPILSKYSCNVISNIIFGDRFEYDDPVFIDLLAKVNAVLSQPVPFHPINFLWPIKYTPAGREFQAQVLDCFESIDQMIGRVLADHEETYDASEVRDFVDFYIKTREESEDSHLYTPSNMRRVIVDLFAAGTETSSTTLDWITLYFAAHPDVQARCQADIDRVAGERPVTMEDRKHLPYVDAVITEILRLVSIASFTVPHCSTAEGTAAGYRVPVNTVVIANVRAVHHNGEVYADPLVFRPERFLDAQGSFVQPKTHFVPFSAGPRACLGESLARMEIFLLFGILVQAFTFSMPEGVTSDLVGTFGITYQAKPQGIIANRR